MPKEIWDKKEAESAFTFELEKAREYLQEKKKITPKPEPFKKRTTLPDDVERVILSDLKVKEDLIEILSNFKNKGMWFSDVKRLTIEAGSLRMILEAHKIIE